MISIQRIDWFLSFQRNSLTALLLAIAGCSENAVAIPDTDFQSGIWLMTEATDRRIDGKTIDCRSMLMEVTITREWIYLGDRAFPCNETWNRFESLRLERSGTALLQKGENVGTLTDRRLEIQLPAESRRIVWDLDVPGAPYSENTTTDEFRTKLELRDDPTPFATNLSFVGTEDIPVKGFVHAARLPAIDVWYQHTAYPLFGKLAYFEPTTGEFRFDPDKNFTGQTHVSFLTFAGDWGHSEAQASITMAGTQDPPQAFDAFATASEGSPVLIMPNVVDPDGDKFTVTVVDPPQHGKVDIIFGSFLYLPEADFSGEDSFTFFASDGLAQSNIAKIEMTVFKTNDPPTVIDQDVYVTAESATPFTLTAIDDNPQFVNYELLSLPQSGQILGAPPDFIYIPPPGVQNGMAELSFRAHDQSSTSGTGKIRFLISPGNHPSELLTLSWTSSMSPVWNDGSRIYYTSTIDAGTSYVGGTDGTLAGTGLLLAQSFDDSGFDNSVGTSRHTTFFKQGPWLLFSTTDKKLGNFYLNQTDGMTSGQLPLWISPPENTIKAEPSVGDAFIDGPMAYLSLSWPRTATEYLCKVVRIDEGVTNSASLVHSIPPANGPCRGFWSTVSAQYMFTGSKLLKFTGMQAAPTVLKDLGNAQPQPWMITVGDKLFFQTRTDIGTDTRIELWVTDGTEIGTKSIKELETAFLEFNIFSPLAFADKLYFAHRKSLWSSDGTEAGTSIVMTMPTSNAIGDGAIGTITASNGKLYFLASSDVFGREPWVSDGTPAGTQMLRDIHVGTKGSATASENPIYFHAWNGQVLFAADSDGDAAELWMTDGTSAGTNQLTNRQIKTIMGVLGNKLIYRDTFYTYALNLL